MTTNEEALRFAAETCLGWEYKTLPGMSESFYYGKKSGGTYGLKLDSIFWRPDTNAEQMALLWPVIERLELTTVYSVELVNQLNPSNKGYYDEYDELELYHPLFWKSVTAPNSAHWQAFAAIRPEIEKALDKERNDV